MNSISSSTTSARWDARLWGALIVLCGVLFLDALDVSMVGVALPSSGPTWTCRTVRCSGSCRGYVLGYGGLLLLGGRTADLLGRRRVLPDRAGGVRGRVGCSAASSTTAPLLIAARFVKGVERRVHRAGRAVDHHDDLRRGPGPQPRAEHLHHRAAPAASRSAWCSAAC